MSSSIKTRIAKNKKSLNKKLDTQRKIKKEKKDTVHENRKSTLGEKEKNKPVIGMGKHTPAFLLRPVALDGTFKKRGN